MYRRVFTTLTSGTGCGNVTDLRAEIPFVRIKIHTYFYYIHFIADCQLNADRFIELFANIR